MLVSRDLAICGHFHITPVVPHARHELHTNLFLLESEHTMQRLL